MPELPEVEAVRRYLVSQGLIGRTITGVELLWPRAVRTPAADVFESEIAGRRIRGVRRRAKYLILELGGRPDRSLIFHFRMTGSLVVQPTAQDRPFYTRNVFPLDGGEELCFVDPRKLGEMWLVGGETEVLGGLGPEPLDPAFTSEVLAERLSGRSVSVKALLCDQVVVAGIGNIYADEVLFLAGIHPLTRGRDMSPAQSERLHDAIVGRLAEAVRLAAPRAESAGERTDDDQGLGLRLPRSKEAPCERCSTRVKRVLVRGRSSFFCPRCQGR